MLLHDLFAAAAARWPHEVAIDVPPGDGRPQRVRWTYAELARHAARIAARLAPLVERECLVAILLPRDSPALFAAQLAVLQAGAAHVCLDPAFPDAHVAHVLADSGAVALLTDAHRARAQRIPVLDVDEEHAAPPPKPPAWLHERSLAYAIYTSGTTGKAKGVLLEHRGAVNLIRAGVARFSLQPGDRIAQGSSPAYDSSIEETWLALASGATLVVVDDATVRLGPDLVPWLARERITVICPPPTLLRALGCRAPRRELPDLRLCYAGGEAIPQDLAELWSKDLWLENGYGPTECTVTVARGRLHPGGPVTIGTPVANHDALVLDERLEPLADGEVGELCFRGPGLARAYLGAPELTEARFPQHPRLGRIYRTGDLARRLPDGRLVCLGRVDAQVKVRGVRIELEAVEAALAQCTGVREAACAVQDGMLVAFVVPSGERTPAAAELQSALRNTLPEAMVPARFGVLGALPRSVGGKLNRRALPVLEAPPATRAAIADERQRAIAAAFAASLGNTAIGADDDFFALGGDSLRAALLVSRLRTDPSTAHLTVRDVYEARTVAGLAARTGTAPPPRAPPQRAGGRPLAATCAQLLCLLLGLLAGSAFAWLVGFVLAPHLCAALGLIAFVLLAPLLAVLLALGYALAALWFAVLVKELLIGRYVAGRAPAFGSLHVRHWMAVRAARLVPWGLLQGTVLQNAALRALGARIGRRVRLEPGVDLTRGGFDLLEIGDDVTIGREASVATVELDDGELVLAPTTIGAGAVLETRAGVGPGCAIGAGVRIAALAHVPAGTRIPDNGAPPAAVDVASREWSPALHGALQIGLRTALAPLFALPFTASIAVLLVANDIDANQAIDWLCRSGPWSASGWIAAAVALSIVALPCSLVLQALLLRLTKPAPTGTISRWSSDDLRIALRARIVESAGTWLSGTLYWPPWLRLAGMRIGAGCEISTILDALPEHVAIGAGSFLADGIYLGAPRYDRGALTLAPTVLGRGTFLGNHAVVPAGQRLPDDLLLGVCTVADEQRMTAASAWFGDPPFPLPRREVVTMDRRLTHAPGPLRVVNRASWEAARMLLPALPLLAVLLWFEAVAASPLLAPAAALAVAAALAAVVLACKWLLLGRVRPGQHGLWSCWASRWDFLYVVWNRYGRSLLAPLEGTLLLAWFLRASGMRIGRRVLLADGFAQVVDPDMLALEDESTVHALFQAHSFEDRVLKIDRVRIGRRATVGRGAVVLYGADVGDGAHVAPHSVVMKHERLLPERAYAGAPTAPAARRELPTAAAPAAALPRERDPALDLARALAVLGMIALHFVPGEAIALLAGKPAALFALLAGMSWAHQAQTQRGAWFARRALALGAAGLAFWLAVWPTDVLAPLALMLPIVAALAGHPARALGLAGALLALAPLATAAFGHYVDVDCRDDGSHAATSTFGWVTLRYFVFDGSYPLLPWLALPLLGAAMVAGRYRDPARSARWFAIALPLALALHACGLVADRAWEELGELWPFVGATWQPTSIPFALQIGAYAVAAVAGLSRWRARRGLPAWTAPLVAFGRLSLTHYVAHIALVFAPLRAFWPDEDWPLAVGLAAALGYVALALPLSVAWLGRCARGPLEAVLRLASDATRDSGSPRAPRATGSPDRRARPES
jgi:non-ribosomal peptide synthetase-like protein